MPNYHNFGVMSYAQFLNRVEQRPDVWVNPDSGSSMESGDDSVKKITRTYGEALHLARNGWQEGAAAIRDAEALAVGAELGAGWTLDVCGRFPCIPAYIAGDAGCMWDHQDEVEQRKRVRLVYQVGYPAYVAPEFMLCYGAALAAITRQLEAAGVVVSLVAIDCPRNTQRIENETNVFLTGITIREFGEPLDLDRVAFVGHSDFLRRLVFAHREMWEPCRVSIANRDGGYGMSRRGLTNEAVSQLFGSELADSIVLPEAVSIFDHYKTANFDLPGVRGNVSAQVLKRFREKIEQAAQVAA